MLKPIDEAKAASALGFAMKAGQVRSGEVSAEKAVKNGAAKLVAVDPAASEQCRKRWQEACAYRSIPYVELKDVGTAIGKEAHMVACIVDNGFAQMLLRACVDKEFES